MQELGPAKAAPTTEELITQCREAISKVMSSEMADESDVDRVWLLRKYHKSYLYYRDLAYFAPALYQGLVDSTGVNGSISGGDGFGDGSGNGAYDYTQNIYRGYCRKMEAVLGTRIPNAVAVPNDPSDEKDIAAARAANSAAQYIRQHCELQVQILWLVFSLFNFGTSFWTIEWVVDGDKYGWKEIPQMAQEDMPLGGGFECPECGQQNEGNPDTPPETCACGAPMAGAAYTQPFNVPAPKPMAPQRIEKGGLEIDILDGTEVSVPLDADGRRGVDDCQWIRRERERHKSKLLQKWGDAIRNPEAKSAAFDDQSASLQYGESVRSAMASPIGVVRPKRENRWTEITEDWTPQMYQMVDDKTVRDLLKENFPEGLRITAVKGIIVDLENRRVTAHWQECQPEPVKRIMADPLGDDWLITNDIHNNLLNQMNETVERSNEPGFADPTRVDLDAWQRRRDNPADLIPAIPPAGRTLADIIHRPAPVEFSEQLPAFRASVEQTSQQTSGLLEVIWGGDTSDPTARQTELKTNAAIRQLSVIWVMIGKSLERVYEKACKLLADHEDGILAFSAQKANEYGKFDTVAVVIEDLKGGNYHFEADEAIPMTWGQQRDLLMWMLDKPAEILKAWGLDDPLNVFEFKNLLGMPGMHVPLLAARDKGMNIIARLIDAAPVPGPVSPNGSAGPKQSSIQPDWEDNNDFMAKLAKSYLEQNFELAAQKPDGYLNVQLWGQAHEQKANVPAPPPSVKATLSTTLKGSDLGDPAVTAALQKVGLIPPGTQAQNVPPPPKPGAIQAPGAMPPPPLPAVQ